MAKYKIPRSKLDELESHRHCQICKRSGLLLQIDHNHVSNKIRGMLCGPCNRALGLFADDPVRLNNAVQYLRGGGEGGDDDNTTARVSS